MNNDCVMRGGQGEALVPSVETRLAPSLDLGRVHAAALSQLGGSASRAAAAPT